ncbi:hypothetical protein OG21DRAFT_544450 [Imleria badia]|nr:hypothetical protein OG21DRAFT_544450 [Imleria badia]
MHVAGTRSRLLYWNHPRGQVPFGILLGGDELKQDLVVVKKEKWEFVDGKRIKVQVTDHGSKRRRRFSAGRAVDSSRREDVDILVLFFYKPLYPHGESCIIHGR